MTATITRRTLADLAPYRQPDAVYVLSFHTNQDVMVHRADCGYVVGQVGRAEVNRFALDRLARVHPEWTVCTECAPRLNYRPGRTKR